MRKRILAALLCACAMLLTGCSELDQVENLAFAVILGVDLTEQGEIEICIQVPKITSQQGEEGSGGSGSSDHLIYSASGKNFDEALNLLQWAVPRKLDLSQINLIVVSEKLAADEHFIRIADTIMAMPRLYTAARLAICKGSAKDFVSAEAPMIGTRMSTELTATFEDYTKNGFIPDTTFADIYYRSRSVYSDPLAIYAEPAPKSESSEGSDSAQAAAAIIPDSTSVSKAEMQQSNRFLGAAVFHEGTLVGRLSGEESLYCKILQGGQQTFAFSLGEQTVGLTTLGAPDVQVDTGASPMQIQVGLRFSIAASSKNAPTEELERELEQALLSTIEACKAMGAEPLNFAEAAAGDFWTMEDWRAFDWNRRFLESDVHVAVHVTPSDA
ncbi:MAG: Ger(x)C family spore germination C-terminal domain-containing protein [Candidatus Faecivicinus sp.]